jgi:uncharacterized protein
MKDWGPRRIAWASGGLVSVTLGAIGAFLPLLPTVPFLLLAAFCFARSNPAWEARLLNHPRYGASLRLWREKGAIGKRGKYGATAAFAISIALGLAMIPLPWSLVPVGVALICGSWIWTRPEG